MKSHVLLLLSGLLSAPLPSAPASPPTQARETLAVITSYDVPPRRGVVRALTEEIRSLFKIGTVQITWRDLGRLDCRESFDHLVVAHFAGQCEVLAEGEAETRRDALGFTHISDGEVLPFLEIDCGRLAALIGPVRTTEPMARKEILFGRALARVLAHEMYHVIAETQNHGKHGLAKPQLTAQELTSERMEFDPIDLDRVRAKIEESMPDINFRSETW